MLKPNVDPATWNIHYLFEDGKHRRYHHEIGEVDWPLTMPPEDVLALGKLAFPGKWNRVTTSPINGVTYVPALRVRMRGDKVVLACSPDLDASIVLWSRDND